LVPWALRARGHRLLRRGHLPQGLLQREAEPGLDLRVEVDQQVGVVDGNLALLSLALVVQHVRFGV